MKKIATLYRTKNNVFEYYGTLEDKTIVAFLASKGSLDIMVPETEEEDANLKDSIKRMQNYVEPIHEKKTSSTEGGLFG